MTQLVRLKRVAVVCGMTLVTANIWTGGPLLAVWIGSRVQGAGPPTMAAIGAVALSLGVISYLLVKVLAVLDDVYARASGRPSSVQRHVPWLRSMRGERPHVQKHARDLSPLEVILIVTVVVAILAFEVWFFFFSGSPIGGGSSSGRD
jgi:hypothetical protein